MKYKVGDKVRIKTWDELVEEFNVDSTGGIILLNGYWAERMDRKLPPDRLIVITWVYYNAYDSFDLFVLPEMIKEKV